MLIEFDADKSAANERKHGVSLALAGELEWDVALVWRDARREYGEQRWCALAPLAARLYFVAFTWRDTALRPISLRRANLREIRRYAEDDHD